MASDFSFLEGPPDAAAIRLLGCELVRSVDGQTMRGRIVETEAYDQTDAASHSYKGETPRTAVMFGPGGYAYVYFTYGMHYCMNVVTGAVGHGSAVLIRALEPLQGQTLMRQNRNNKPDLELMNGPAKLCQALQINMTWNGHDLHKSPLTLVIKPPLDQTQIIQTNRIGISQAKDVPWRFYVQGNQYVSKP